MDGVEESLRAQYEPEQRHQQALEHGQEPGGGGHGDYSATGAPDDADVEAAGERDTKREDETAKKRKKERRYLHPNGAGRNQVWINYNNIIIE